ncbi:MAG: aldo/keto reductase [Anaerolineae bacterium]|nr:aldo/keto reductase [Anaerolineae bacterium]
MKYARLGATGLTVSRICLGMMSYGSHDWREWVLDYDEGYPIVKRAIELGINFFDTANVYSTGMSEEVTGKYLKEFFNSRDEYVVATKVFGKMGDAPNMQGLSRKHIMDSVDASLRRLKVDYIDLYQIHRWDYNTPILETMEALHDVVKSGKVRYIGASSMWAWQFSKAQYVSCMHNWTRFVSMQNHYSLVYREEEREMNPLCEDMGVGLIPWSPLARGFLAGNFSRVEGAKTIRAKTDQFVLDWRDVDFDVRDRVAELAERHGVTPAQIALAWLLQRPAVTSPIVGATKLHHIEQAVAAPDIALTEDEVDYIEEPYMPRPIHGHN